MSFADRQLKVRVLEALELRVKQFKRREELFPLRIPHEPLPLGEIVADALGPGARRFDPQSLRSRPLLHLSWDDASTWDLWVIVLPSKVKLFCDSGAEESRVLASGGRNEGDETDRLFLQLLAESGGAHFGIEMSGDAPSRVRSAITDREFLVETFVELFEVSGMEASVRAQVEDVAPDDRPDGSDFRTDVERWLDVSLIPNR
jgi:hypothetical protein